MSRRRMRATHASEKSECARLLARNPNYTFILLYVFNDAEAVNLLISNNIMTGPVRGALLAFLWNVLSASSARLLACVSRFLLSFVFSSVVDFAFFEIGFAQRHRTVCGRQRGQSKWVEERRIGNRFSGCIWEFGWVMKCVRCLIYVIMFV